MKIGDLVSYKVNDIVCLGTIQDGPLYKDRSLASAVYWLVEYTGDFGETIGA